MKSAQHLIITKFNVQWDGRDTDRRGRPVRTREWVQHRLDLFERFCLPSLQAQTSLDFTWLVRYAEDTEPEVLERLQSHERTFPNLTLIPSRRWFLMSIAKRVRRGVRWLLTTRLDSDDALHRDAVALVRDCARPVAEPEFLNLRFGYCFEHPGGSLARLEEPSTFLSLVEPVRSTLPKTVTCVNHQRAAEFAPVRQIGAEPMWLQVVHARNLSNLMRGTRCAGVDLEAAFGVSAG